MQVRDRCADLGKVIGFRADHVLSRGFKGELAEARKRIGYRVHELLFDLFERDPPRASVRGNLFLPGENDAGSKVYRRSVAGVPLSGCYACRRSKGHSAAEQS